ncbi:MAG TPA: DUF4019 domain-containing protein [Longimicrobium sp.]|nr:DUF4019 domain-containing protein [Longimicrobium sp.]
MIDRAISRLIRLVVAVLLAMAGLLLSDPLRAQPDPRQAAEAMRAWLELIDAGRYAEGWAAAGTQFRGAIAADAWETTTRRAREPYAGTPRRAVMEAKHATSLPGLPPGDYAQLRFETHFSGGRAGVERVVAVWEDGAWKALGYFIAPWNADYGAPAGAPYTAENVTIPTPAGHTLAGTLTLPRGAAGPVPAVVLISGSGPQDRDSSIPGITGYAPFRQIADTLTRRGIAVLRVDDRGTGASGGDPAMATTADLADDTRAAIAFLRARPEIDADRIALAGHSEGGIIAPMVAADDARIAAVALLAGQGWTGRRTSDSQLRAVWSSMGMSEAKMDSMKAVNDPLRERQAAQMPWVRFWMDHDPATALRRVRVPALVLQGGTDWQVAPEQAEVIAAALREGGNADVTVRVFPGLNHLFLYDPEPKISPDHYGSLPGKEVPPAVLSTLAEWLAAKLKR